MATASRSGGAGRLTGRVALCCAAAVLIRILAAATLVFVVPPLVVALRGGADLEPLPGFRVSWYAATAPALACLGALAACLAPTPRGRAWRLLRGLAVLVLAVAALVLWTGGFRSEAISITDPVRPGAVGLLLLVAATLGALPRAARALPGPGPRGALVPLALGALLLAGLLTLERARLERARAAPRAALTGPDVLFLLVDTLRADALGSYGADPSPSPFLDELAARAVVFERAIAQAPWTVPSVLSLLTGRHPSSLDPEGRGAAGRSVALPPEIPSLASSLRRAGYHTAGFQKNPYLGPGSGLEQGFDVYEAVGGNRAELRSAAQLVDAALRWADGMAAARRRGDGTPFFLYLHFMDPHVDYRPPDIFLPAETREYEGPMDGRARSLHRLLRRAGGPAPADIAQMRALYRGEVAYLDSQVRRLHERLAGQGLWTSETLVVFTADHGEQFGEHGSFEHRDIHVENVHVPLWIAAPGLKPHRVATPVALLDVAPTLLDLVSLPVWDGSEGRSLRPALRGGTVRPRPVVTEFGAARRITGPRFSLLRTEDGDELYDLQADPGEQRDRAAERAETVEKLRAELERHEARASQRGPTLRPRDLDPETREALEALGYL